MRAKALSEQIKEKIEERHEFYKDQDPYQKYFSIQAKALHVLMMQSITFKNKAVEIGQKAVTEMDQFVKQKE